MELWVGHLGIICTVYWASRLLNAVYLEGFSLKITESGQSFLASKHGVIVWGSSEFLFVGRWPFLAL